MSRQLNLRILERVQSLNLAAMNNDQLKQIFLNFLKYIFYLLIK